jgi:hypothetical protein
MASEVNPLQICSLNNANPAPEVTREKEEDMKKWKCPEIGKRIEVLREAKKNARTLNRLISVYGAFKSLDHIITIDMQDDDNDMNALLTYRRIVRQELRAFSNI